MAGARIAETVARPAAPTATGGSGSAMQPIATHSATGQCTSRQQIRTDDAIAAALCRTKIKAIRTRRQLCMSQFYPCTLPLVTTINLQRFV